MAVGFIQHNALAAAWPARRQWQSRCFCPPESRWGAWRVNSIHTHRLQRVIHPAADFLRWARPDFPEQRPHLLPPRWQQSGCPGSETPCPPGGGSPARALRPGRVIPSTQHVAATGQQHGVEMLGQRGFPAAVVAQNRHKAALLEWSDSDVSNTGTCGFLRPAG